MESCFTVYICDFRVSECSVLPGRVSCGARGIGQGLKAGSKLGFRVSGFRVSGLRGFAFGVGFRGLVFRVSGVRVRV